jgi:hypothetical protein
MQYNSTLLGRQCNQYEICKNKIIQQHHTHISQNLTFCLPDSEVHQGCGTESSYIVSQWRGIYIKKNYETTHNGHGCSVFVGEVTETKP